MKALKYLSFAVIVICIAACSNGGGKITPTSKKINGPLGKFFEVVDRDYKISDNELSVEFKRIAEGGPTDASWSSEPTFIVELQDEDGNVISTKSTDVVYAEEQLESVFSLGIDESASITFRFNKSDGTAKFKVSSKWNVDEEDDNSDNNLSYSEIVSGNDGIYDLHGTIDEYLITMNIRIDGAIVKGTYYYDKQGSNAKLTLSGTNEDGLLDINETNAEGMPTGHFRGNFANGVFRGKFVSYQGKEMPFVLTEGDADYAYNNDDSFEYDDNDDEDVISNNRNSNPEVKTGTTTTNARTTSTALAKEALREFEKLVNKLEKYTSVNDNDAREIEKMIDDFENKYGNIQEDQFSQDDLQKAQELIKRRDSEKWRLRSLYNPSR